MSFSLLGLQWTDLSFGLLLTITIFFGLLIPYLIKVNRDGKRIRRLRKLEHGKATLDTRTPAGAGDNMPGTPRNPAPGQPDGWADPYSPQAQREAPPVKS